MLLKDSGPIIACPLTYNYIDMAYNFIENLKKFNLEKNIYFLCLDEDVYKELSSKVFCVKADKLIKKIKNRGDWIEAEKHSKMPLFIHILKTFKRDLFLCDVDVIFLKDPLPLFYKDSKDYNIVSSSDKPYFGFNLARKKDHIVTCVPLPVDYGPTDQKKYGFMNGAVSLYIYNKDFVKKLESVFTEKLLLAYPKRKEAGAAQTIYNFNIKKTNAKVKILSVFEIANGSLLNIPYLKKRVLEEATGIHYNFCNPDPHIGYQQKIEKIKSDGNWFI
jgi:hypothetical protein